jgi:hypothetical protein
MITGADTSRWNSAASGNHAELSNLLWTASGHTGTPARLAGFFEGGAAGYSAPGAGLYFDGDDKLAVSNAVLAGAAAGATAVQPTDAAYTNTQALAAGALQAEADTLATVTARGGATDQSLQIGQGAPGGSWSIGWGATATNGGVAIGALSAALFHQTVAIGVGASATNVNSISIGGAAHAPGVDNAVAIGSPGASPANPATRDGQLMLDFPAGVDIPAGTTTVYRLAADDIFAGAAGTTNAITPGGLVDISAQLSAAISAPAATNIAEAVAGAEHAFAAAGRYDVYDGARWTNTSAMSVELVSRTISLTTNDTETTIQAALDGIGRYIPFGVSVTVQFPEAAKTYALSSGLSLGGFYGGGQININGHANASGLRTNQNTHLDGSAIVASGSTLVIYNSTVVVRINDLKVTCPNNVAGYGIRVQSCMAQSWVDGCYVLQGTKNANMYGVIGTFAPYVQVSDNYFENMGHGVSSWGSRVYSINNDDNGTAPTYGLSAGLAGTIGKLGTQPAGSTAGELVAGGGVIR